MNYRNVFAAAAVSLVMSGMTAGAAFSATQDDCAASPPSAELPAPATTDNMPQDTAQNNLTSRLATCGSVLNPPAVGDPDIVEPVPPTDDPINIHPGVPGATKP